MSVDVTFQAQPPSGVPEGLPFWLLWLLLCIILLLVAFIFLRDKDLRRRISAFLSGARRHMARLRIQVKLKRESGKKSALWRELGKLAWNENVQAPCIKEECGKLAVLEEEIGRHQKTWHDVYSRIEALGREHDGALKRFKALMAEQEEARRPHQEEVLALANEKGAILEAIEDSLREADAAEAQVRAVEKEIRQIAENPKLGESDKTARLARARDRGVTLGEAVRANREKAPLLQEQRYRLERRLEEAEGRVRVFNAAIHEVEEDYRERLRVHEREIRAWQRTKERVQDKIVDVKRLMEPLFENIGRLLDEVRLDHEDMAVLYFQIDGVNKTIEELEARLEHLK